MPTVNATEEIMLTTLNQVLRDYKWQTQEKIDVLTKRVIAAEETSKAATAQMTAVLAVLNVLAAYAGPPKEMK